MSKRRSDEARVLAYFEESPVEKAELMLGLVRDVVRRRVTPTRVVKVTASRKRTRVGKATPTAATAFEPEAMAAQ